MGSVRFSTSLLKSLSRRWATSTEPAIQPSLVTESACIKRASESKRASVRPLEATEIPHMNLPSVLSLFPEKQDVEHDAPDFPDASVKESVSPDTTAQWLFVVASEPEVQVTA